MIHALPRCALLLVLGAWSWSSHAAGDQAYRQVGGGKDLVLRAKPDKDSRVVFSGLRKGDPVRVLACEKHNGNSWCRVEFSNNIGWIGEQRLQGSTSGGAPPQDIWEVTGARDGVPLRSKPDKDAKPVIQALRNGDRVNALACEKHNDHQWCRVQFEGYVGWIGKERLRRP
jgi:SH3-like domain-containing protein